MNRVVKILIIFLVVDAILVAGYLGYKVLTADKPDMTADSYEWVTVDEYYQPRDYIEGFIRDDAEQRGILPVQIRNYGKDKKVLKKFRGKNFAGPGEAQLRLKYRGLEDWKLVEIKFTGEREQEVLRAVLYVYEDGEWKVGDNGVITR
jgi:hypothetical protein